MTDHHEQGQAVSEIPAPDPDEYVVVLSNGHRWQIPPRNFYDLNYWHCLNCGITISPASPADPCKPQI